MKYLLICVLCLSVTLAQAALSVKDFGATGDGKTDDSHALQNAIDSGTDSLHFPKGTYRINRGLVATLNESGFLGLISDGSARILMHGAGPAIKIIGTHHQSADPKNFKPEVWEKQRMPMIQGLEIVGVHEDADGIEAIGTMQLTLNHLRLHRLRHGIVLSKHNRNLSINQCHIYENRGIGLFFNEVNLHQANVVGSHISYNAGGGIVLVGGNVRNLQIGTCDIESNMSAEKDPTANILIDCRGGSTAEVTIVGCTIQHNSKSPESANIRVLGEGTLTPNNESPTQEGHITISANVFSDVRQNIHLQQARGVSITGNTFWEGFDHDLLIENSQNILVVGNNFDRNPRYSVNGNDNQERNGIVFRQSQDSKFSSNIVKGVRGHDAAVLFDNCNRITVNDCSIFDSDNVLLELRNTSHSFIAQCLLRDDRETALANHALKVTGGSQNRIALIESNRPIHIDEASITTQQTHPLIR